MKKKRKHQKARNLGNRGGGLVDGSCENTKPLQIWTYGDSSLPPRERPPEGNSKTQGLAAVLSRWKLAGKWGLAATCQLAGTDY